MTNFFDNYDKWRAEALEEFKDSKFWCDDYNEGHLEITEDGSVYLGNSHWINNVVTSWEDSNYYTE